MANGDQPVVGGASEMFTIKIPTGATKAAGGGFEVTPAVPVTRLVITGPTAANNITLQPDGIRVVWDIPTGVPWTISIE